MRLSGYQPQYFPRLHYFARMLDSDIFRVIDYVQFVRSHIFIREGNKKEQGKSFQAHTTIKITSGPYLLAVPTVHTGEPLPINQTPLDYRTKWQQKHDRTINLAYSRAPRARELQPEISSLLNRTYEHLAELNITTMFWAVAKILGVDVSPEKRLTTADINQMLSTQPHPFRLRRLVVMSETDIPPHGPGQDATDWIIDCTKKLGANEYYYGGSGAAAYLDLDRLQAAGIRSLQQHWVCSPYRQLHHDFVPNLSIIDLLLNEDTPRVQEVLLGST